MSDTTDELRAELHRVTTENVGLHAQIVSLRAEMAAQVMRIPLTGGRWTIVDKADYDAVAHLRWRAGPGAKTWYAWHNFARGETPTSLHRYIMQPPTGLVVDHINGDGLDNRRINLRVCTQKENVRNRIHGPISRSGFRGVFGHPSGREARIKVNGKSKHLGTFATAEEAALAYDRAATEHFGEFAQTNFKLAIVREAASHG